MAFLLKEALRCLCRDGGWSYAVFWKIHYQNPNLLVWEEGHYELMRRSELLQSISKIGSRQWLPKELDVVWNPPQDIFGQRERREEDRIDILVNRMMMPQVHVVGEGIVGRAFALGNHQWILGEGHFDREPISETQEEVFRQFSAGIQTIAVIPLLPHGVVQLGSIQMIMENLGFVSHVKSLFMQVRSVPGALLSDNNALSQEMQAHVKLGIAVSADQFRNSCSGVARFTPPIGGSQDQKLPLSPASRFVSQPSCSVFKQTHDVQTNVSLVPLASNPDVTATNKFDGGFSHSRAISVVKPRLHQGDELEEDMGTQVIIPNSEVGLNQHMLSHTSSSRSDHSISVVRSSIQCHKLGHVKQQIRSSLGSQEPAHKYIPTSPDNMKTPQLESHGCKASSSIQDSVIVSLLGISESCRTRNESSISNQCPSSLPLEDIAFQSDRGVIPVSFDPNHSSSTCLISGESLPSYHSNGFKHTTNVGTIGEQRIWKDSFESIEGPSADFKDPISWIDRKPIVSLEDYCWGSSSMQVSGNAILEENGIFITNCRERLKGSNESLPHSKLNESSSNESGRSPAGCDLFDALGLDFKIQQCHHGWDDVLLQGVSENAGNLKEDASSRLPQLDVPLFDQMNDVISESAIFSALGTDQLLDAVVSKIHSGAKPILNGNVSCSTTLTRASSSSIHNSSRHSGMAVLEQIPRVLYGLPQDLAKPDPAEPSSFKASCILNKTGVRPQSSVYESQTSLWTEDGLSMKCDSTSTAFSKRSNEAGKPNRKRSRPGENPRPRPKDRQMIQDRLKELREIVPNGAKYSIDALLDRTIKHMVFLQSVTKHAEKLKQTRESKVISKEDGLCLKDNSSSGKTLAFEISSQSVICPIIVEDLNEPHQMLVEILCEERGCFLEIADIIRGLGLTILKGVMQARDNKVWSRFSVEANEDVTRMNVFMSLMHLLEQTTNSCSTVPEGVSSGSARLSTHSQSSIPFTSLADAFQ
ncbi:hypothetical protein AAC387_Pa05g0865 [Persea americana]